MSNNISLELNGGREEGVDVWCGLSRNARKKARGLKDRARRRINDHLPWVDRPGSPKPR
jgi:hypothetical protein